MEHMHPENDNKPYVRGERIELRGKALESVRTYFQEEPPYIFLCYGSTKNTCLVTSQSTWNNPHLRKRIPEQIPSKPLELANYDLPPHIYGISTSDVEPIQEPKGI